MNFARRCAVVGMALLFSLSADAHDPSAWGGMFRTRDGGTTWLPIDGGLFIGGAISVAIDPTDTNHLLYATDTRLLRSRNGGREWAAEAPSVFFGPALGVAFDAKGGHAIAATSSGVYRNDGAREWLALSAPAALSPARAVTAGSEAGRFYVAGAHALYSTADSGTSWSRIGEELPQSPASSFFVVRGANETVYAVIEGKLYAGADRGASWTLRNSGFSAPVDAAAADPVKETRLWAASNGRLYRSDDAGQNWQPHGAPFQEAGLHVRGIGVAVDQQRISIATHRGLFRSTDSGQAWTMVESNLPVHLETAPFVRDPRDPDTLYAGFSLTPFSEIWRRAEQGNSMLSQIDPVSLGGGAAFFLLVCAGGFLLVRRLMRASRNAAPTNP